MFHRFLLVAATAVSTSFAPALAGTAAPPPASSVAPKTLTPADVQARMPEVRAVVSRGVFYYQGSVFRDVRAGTKAGDPAGMFHLCGWVNEDKVTHDVGWRTFTILVWPTGGTGLPPTFRISGVDDTGYCPITDPIPGDYTADVSAQPAAKP